MRKVKGKADAAINSKAGRAARAKNASDAADQMEVARVVNPMGLRMSVAGNSFITSKNTRAHPASNPGRTIGNVTDENARIGLFPSPLAASSNRGLTCNIDVRKVPRAGDTNSTT